MGYDKVRNCRFIGIKLKLSLSIEFELRDRGIIEEAKLNKGETILLWHYDHQSAQQAVDTFESNGFDVIHSSQTPDREFMILVATVKQDR